MGNFMMAVAVEDVRKADEKREAVDAAMESWARWAKSAFAGIGWPPISLLGKIIKFGVRGAAQQAGCPIEEVDEVCELVDRGLMRLPEQERECIITHYYKWQSMNVSAIDCGVPVGTFRRLLHQARRSLSDYLEGARYSLRSNESSSSV